MTAATAPDRYPPMAQALHWLIALLAFTQLAMGKLFEVEADEGDESLLWLHAALGLLVLVLMVVRIGWRATHAVPAPPPATPPRERLIARVLFAAFYAILILLPMSGWALASIEGEPVSFFGLFTVPPLPLSGGEEAEDFIEEAHEILGNLLLLLVALHVAASLKHHFINRDDVLRRMLPGRGR